MMTNTKEETGYYLVVVNDGAQYSIWPEHTKTPAGWRSIGKTGTKLQCLDYIGEVWTNMAPLSLRRLMEARTLPS
jgi:MbtH protein